MKTLLLLLLLVSPLAQATQHTLAFDSVVGATGYRAYFSATPNGQTFKTLDIASTTFSVDDTSFPSPWYVCVAATDGTTYFQCSDTVCIGGSVCPQPQKLFPLQGWKSVTALTFDKAKVLRVGGFTWPGPVWSVTGGSNPGVPVPAPVVDINGIYFCDWPYGLVQCEYRP